MLIEEAIKSGAEIIKFEYSAGSKIIKYLSRTGFTKEHTIYRARETLWGQSGYKQGEMLTGLILKSLLPGSEWYGNKRYDFLSFNSEKLELDGYCEELGIAFEHQGRQHYNSKNAFDSSENSFHNRVARDKFKIAQCEKKGIKLLIIDQQKICVHTYLNYILSELNNANINYNKNYDINELEKKWMSCSENVLKEFQRVLLEKIGPHKIICDDVSKIKKTDFIRYECNVCGEINSAQAKGFIHGPQRKFCPNCRSNNNSAAKRDRSIQKYKSEIPANVFEMLDFSRGSRIKITCDFGHTEVVTSINNLNKKIKNGSFVCTGCKAISLGYADDSSYSRQSYASIIKVRPAFMKLIKKTGLSLIGEIYMSESACKPMVSAKLMCSEKHEFELSVKELKFLINNKFISDSFVPTVCPECCYPGNKNAIKKATVFHRVNILKDFHKNVRYVSGFDPKGVGTEFYNCGNFFPSSITPHPNFSIVYKSLSSTEKLAVKRMPCYICAVENFVSISPGAKTLEMINARMKLISDSIRAITGGQAYIPSATYRGYGLCPEFISTTKCILDFHCGNPKHDKVSRTCDNYFSYHKIGFCKKCVAETGVNNVKGILLAVRSVNSNV